MARTFSLSVVAPDRSILDDEPVTSLVAPGTEGYFGVMAGHTPLIAALRPGLLEYVDAATGSRSFVAVGGGFVEVTPTKVTVLADDAERTQDIDVAQAEAEVEEARRALRGESSVLTTEEATGALDRAMNRLRAARMAQRG
jgi:F-type H+-transporting ATPase subunit epsilon